MNKTHSYTATIGTEKVQIETEQKITHGTIVSIYGTEYVAGTVILSTVKLNPLKKIVAKVKEQTNE